MTPFETSTLLDLTHTLDETTFCWPGDRAFQREEACGATPAGHWYTVGSFGASDHSGTHMDGPVHFSQGQAAIDKISLEQFISPAVVVDMAEACAADPDYELSCSDLAAWEAAHGPIPAGAVVLARSGWSERWPDRRRYLGSESANDFHFPGVAPNAAKLLVGRRVHGVGIDTASLDHGPSQDYPTHRILGGAGVYGLENLANLHLLPAAGATVIALPLKIGNGSGAPARVIAILPIPAARAR